MRGRLGRDSRAANVVKSKLGSLSATTLCCDRTKFDALLGRRASGTSQFRARLIGVRRRFNFIDLRHISLRSRAPSITFSVQSVSSFLSHRAEREYIEVLRLEARLAGRVRDYLCNWSLNRDATRLLTFVPCFVCLQRPLKNPTLAQRVCVWVRARAYVYMCLYVCVHTRD